MGRTPEAGAGAPVPLRRLRPSPGDGPPVRLVLAGHGRDGNLGLNVGDDPLRVAARRAALGERLGVRAVAWLDQRHGVGLVAAGSAVPTPGPVAADAVWTDDPELACAVLVADCVPVLFWTGDGHCCGAVHAGWRGLAAGVLERMPAAAPVRALRAWVGPAIGPCCFEVGEEVVDALAQRALRFGAGFRRAALLRHVRRGQGPRPHLALADWVRDELLALGIRRIHGWRRCTYCSGEGFPSHRRDRAAGRREARMAALVAPAPAPGLRKVRNSMARA